MSEKTITRILSTLHPQNEWAFFSQLRTTTGFKDHRFIDAFAIHLWPSQNHLRIAYEIKTDRSDFENELQDPEKAMIARILSHKFYYVLTTDIHLRKDHNIIPRRTGLIVVDPLGVLEVVVKAQFTEAYPMPEGMIVSMLRNMREGRTYNNLPPKRAKKKVSL